MNLKEEKNSLRAAWRRRREALPAEERTRRDIAVCEAVAASASYRYADTVLGYAPIGCEIDVWPFLERAISEGKRVALPRTHGEGVMTFHYVGTLGEAEPTGAFGIREPREDAPLYEGEGTALMLVPGMVFDRDGFRIGYGGGYYDRFLRGRRVATLGIVYRDFILARLPRGRYDRAVGALATDRGILPIPQ